MSKSSNNRLFISYAWKDDQPFVERIYNDLLMLGYDAWMDKMNMPSRGRSLPREVEEQLQARDRVIAVMGPEAIVSEACQAERAFAFNAGKVVTAILRLGDYKELPAQLSQYFVPDFRISRPYEAALDELQRVLQEPPVIPGRLFDVPALPLGLQSRPDEFLALRESITAAELKDATVITSAGHVGLQGMGGVGKTVMATLAARDYAVRRQFQNGIIWLTFGRQPNILSEVQKALAALGNDGIKYDELSLARMQLGQVLEGKECLLILDDVWSAADVEPFVRAINPRCRLLITTRVLDVVGALGAHAHPLDVLTVEQSRDLLAQRSGYMPNALPPGAEDIVQECGRLPLALAMIGAMLRGKPPMFWSRVLSLLRNADLDKMRTQFPDYPYTNLLSAIQVSVDALDSQGHERYLALAVMLEDMPIHPVIQQTLWGADELDALDSAEEFVNLSLAQRHGDDCSILLHDLQLDYVRAQYPDRETLRLIHSAVRLSVSVVERDPRQFVSQLAGRLLPHDTLPDIQRFTRLLTQHARWPWLRLLNPALHQPGTALVRTLVGHSSAVNGVAMTSDGRLAVSASDDKTLKVWNLETGRELRTLVGHKANVRGVAMSADGRHAVSISHDNTLKQWDVESGRELRSFTPADYCCVVALSGDGRRAVTSEKDRLRVLNLETGEIRKLKGHSGCSLDLDRNILVIWVTDVAISADGRLAISASSDHTLKVWDVETGHERCTLKGHSDDVLCVAMTGDGRFAISSSKDNTLKVWELEKGREVRTLINPAYSDSVAISADGRRAVVNNSRERWPKVWDLESGHELCTLEGHAGGANSLTISADGRFVVTASDDHTLKVWNLDVGQKLGTTHRHRPDLIYSMAVSADGRFAVFGSSDNTLKVWDVETCRELRTLKGHSGYVFGVSVTPDGKRIVSASHDKTLKVWDLESGQLLHILEGHSDEVNRVATCPDGRHAVSVSRDHTLVVWNLETGRALQTIETHAHYLFDVGVSVDGKYVVSAGIDDRLTVWDLNTGHMQRRLESGSWYFSVFMHTLNELDVISCCIDCMGKIWDIDTGRELRRLTPVGHNSKCVKQVKTSRDGRLAVFGFVDGTVDVWDLKTGAYLTEFTCDASIRSCDIAGTQVVIAADEGGRVYFLSLELKDDP